MKYKVSVVVLTYYHEQFLEAALESVINQKCNFDFEVLVSDDCSKDNTLAIAHKYEMLYPNKVKVFSCKNNVGTCRNFYDAFMRCEGKYIVSMAGDDCFCDNEKLQKQVDFLEKEENSSYIAVATSVKEVFLDGVESKNVFPDKKYRGKEFNYSDFVTGNNYPVHGLMVRNIFKEESVNEEFKNIYYFSKYVEDLTYNFFLFNQGRVFVLEDVTYAVTTRGKVEKNQHNYNTIRAERDKIIDHIELLNKINDYYGGDLNLKNRYSSFLSRIVVAFIKTRDISFIKCFKLVPRKYWKYTLFGILKSIERKARK